MPGTVCSTPTPRITGSGAAPGALERQAERHRHAMAAASDTATSTRCRAVSASERARAPSHRYASQARPAAPPAARRGREPSAEQPQARPALGRGDARHRLAVHLDAPVERAHARLAEQPAQLGQRGDRRRRRARERRAPSSAAAS